MKYPTNIFKLVQHHARDLKQPINVALAYFDSYYGKVYGKKWPSIRIALLAHVQKGALVTNSKYDTSNLTNLGTLNLRDVYNSAPDLIAKKELETPLEHPIIDSEESIVFEQSSFVASKGVKTKEKVLDPGFISKFNFNSSLEIEVERFPLIKYPPFLDLFVFPWGNPSKFPEPEITDEVPHYALIDASRLLTILALDLKADSKVLDLCAAPGGFTLMILLTRFPGLLVSNDRANHRVVHIINLLKKYGLDDLPESKLLFSREKAHFLDADEEYNRVLVDPPTTFDRWSVTSNERNIFCPKLLLKRRNRPQLQAELLKKGLKCLKPGGALVYTTATLSPMQNDAVVIMALQDMSEKSRKKYVVQDLSETFSRFDGVFLFSKQANYGHIVLPNVCADYGPRYICRIVRKS